MQPVSFARWTIRFILLMLVFLYGTAAHAGVAIPRDSAAAITLGHRLDIYWIVEKVLTLLIPAAFLLTGVGAWLRQSCGRLARDRRYATLILFGCAYVVFSALLRLPFDYLRHYRLPKTMGWLGDETLGGWLLEQLPPLVVLLLAVILFLWVPYALIRRSPQRWWLWSTVVLTMAALFVLFVQPVWIKPLTTTYTPLSDPALRTQIDALAQRCGIRNIPIVVGGDDTSVLGLGPTNRVILQHDLAKQETPAQIRFTIGHELKHYLMGDNWKALAIVAVLLLMGFWITHRFGRWSIARWHRRFGFDRLDDPASLPLFVLCLSALWLAVTPAFLAFDRHIEAEADRFGFELTHENVAAAQMFAGWAGDAELAEPGWFERTFRDTHPSVAERIRMADNYRPWATGAPLKYANACAMGSP